MQKYSVSTRTNIRKKRSGYWQWIEFFIGIIKAKARSGDTTAGTEWKTLDNGEHVLINSETGEVIKGAGGSLNKNKDKNKKGLGNSENNNKINKEKTKKGDKDGRQEQDKQQSTDREKQRRKELKKRAINRIREWMDGGGYNGFISKPYTRTGNNSAQNGLVEYSIEAKPEIKRIT